MTELIPTIEINGLEIIGGFRPIEGFDNIYCVNPFGIVVAPSYVDKRGFLRKTKILTPTKESKGYLRVGLLKNNKQLKVSVHRLVAQTFIDNPEDKPQVNHLDGNKSNNHTSNLEWCTNQENIIHSYRTGLRVGTNATGERNTMAKLSDSEAIKIIKSDKTVLELSAEFNVSKSCIYKIKQRKRWGHL